MKQTLSHFSLVDGLREWADNYTDHASIKYYLSLATFKHIPEFNNVTIFWPMYEDRAKDELSREAHREFIILYEAMNERGQENIFPARLDSFNLSARYGLNIVPFPHRICL